MIKSAGTSFGFLVLVLAAMISPALAQSNYPSAPIRLVVAYPSGSVTDIVARLLAQRLSVQMNTSAVVDNKPGATGNVGSEFVAKSRPDGYTALINTTGVMFSKAFGEKLGYDLFEDLAPVTLVGTAPQVLVEHPSLPANNVTEFIAYVRANPNKLAYSSSGTGGITHLAGLLFLQTNGLTALHVPYKGGVPATNDLVAGNVQFRFVDITGGVPFIKEKRLKALAIASLKRASLLPDVPTLAETVMPGFEIGSWFGMFVAAKTPPAIVARLNAEVAKAMQDPEMKSRLGPQGVEPLVSTPEEYLAYVKSELERWSKVIKSANIKPE